MTHASLRRALAAGVLATCGFLGTGTALSAQSPYGHHELENLIDAKTGVLDRERFDRAFEDLAAHAQNYPPSFETEAATLRAKRDAALMGAAADRWIARGEGDAPPPAADLVRAGRIWSIAHNLDIEGAAARATAVFDRAVEAHPDDADVHFCYGAFLGSTATGQQKARPHLERSVELGNEFALWALGINCLMTGDQESAVRHLEAYGKAFPDDERVGQVLEAIRSGAVNRREEPAADAQQQDVSVVVLMRAPKTLALDTLREAAEAALGAEALAEEDAVLVRGDRALVRLREFALMVVSENGPAVEDVDAFADSIEEGRVQAAVRAHDAVLRVLASPDEAPRADKLRAASKLAAALMGEDGLALSFSDEPRLFAVTETTARRLRANQPLAAMKQPDKVEVRMADSDSPEMAAAIAKARASLPELRTHVANGLTAAVKLRFEEGENVEHMWVQVTVLGETTGKGRLDNDPVWIQKTRPGDEVSFEVAEIEDWICTVDGERKGGFTVEVLQKTRRDPEGDSPDRGDGR